MNLIRPDVPTVYGCRPDDIFCNAHITAPVADRGWWVPMIQDTDGSVWGYTSVPELAIRGWEILPDADPHSYWKEGHWYAA